MTPHFYIWPPGAYVERGTGREGQAEKNGAQLFAAGKVNTSNHPTVGFAMFLGWKPVKLRTCKLLSYTHHDKSWIPCLRTAPPDIGYFGGSDGWQKSRNTEHPASRPHEVALMWLTHQNPQKDGDSTWWIVEFSFCSAWNPFLNTHPAIQQ